MEQNSLAAVERLTALAFFRETGAGSYVPFGNITMVKMDLAPKVVTIPLYKRGKGNLFRRDNYLVEPVFSITVDQFFSSVVKLMILGDKAADVVQGSGNAITYSFTAAKGQAYYIGARNATIASVKIASTTKTLGVDFFVDDPNIPQSMVSLNGIIILPETVAGITDGSSVDVVFTNPALTREQYNAFTRLNRGGSLKLYFEDETGGDAREIWDLTVQLSAKTIGDFDPTKFRDCVLEAAVFGNPVITTRPS
jgi:hypothetical protein